jgi:endonuclease YncB( thermonuclease family)
MTATPALRAAALALALAAMPALANAETLAGPYEARYVSAYDGDTVRLDIRIWLGLTIHTAVRLRGVDAPEIRGGCEAEKALAIAARDYMRTALAGAERVHVSQVEEDKYGGRVVADVAINGWSAAALLVEAGLARPYDGGAREGWCG